MSHRTRVLSISALTALSLLAVAPVAVAAAPDAATLVGPADGTTAATVDVPLSVRATDADGGSVDVRFVGRKVGATVPGGSQENPFTVVALPDTQNYTYNNREGTIVQQAQWAVDTRAQLGTAMVVQLGDLVSEYDNLTQWGHTSAGLKVLDDANMPNTVVPGNHDFNNTTGVFTQFDASFPPSRYAGKPWTPSTARYGGYLGQNLFGPDPVDRRNMDNFALFTAGGRDFVVLNLEWEAPQYALDWATKVLAAYPDRLAILATHSFVGLNGQRRTTAERPGGTPANTIWTNFVSQQCAIRLVLNGHFHDGNLGEANRSDLNRCGQPVQQIVTDYQDRPNGGDGWLRYYTFDPAANTMKATTYSPKLNQFETDADSSFTLPFDLSAPQPAPFTDIGTVRITSGDVARVTWTGLTPDTLYEWQAIVDDGTSTTTSATWTVRTPQSADLVDDTFTRNVTNGWGAPDAGHTWQLNGALTSYSVDGSVGRVSVPAGSGRGGTLTGVSGTDVRVTTDLALAQPATGSGTYASLLARGNGTTSYRAKLRYVAGGVLAISVGRFVSGTETTLVTTNVAGVTATPGLPLRLRLETEGTSPTTVRAKVWPVGGTEPSTWMASATDSTAGLQTAGTAGLDLYTSGSATAPSALSFDRFTVTRLGVPPPPNQSPTAVIGAPTISGRTVTLSGAGSSDPDGSVAGYAWGFGDNTTGTGSSTSHTYAVDGTYTVSLTVTDDKGATGSTTRSVTVSAPPANQSPTAVIGTPTISGRTVTLSGAGSSDPDGTVAGYAWSFGDNTTGTGSSTSHTYPADGTYTVTLTVTDDQGATGSTTRSVTVAAPPADALARDAFGRTLSGGWGPADVGGSWIVGGAANRYSVDSGTGRQTITAPGTTADAMLTSVSDAATDLRLTLAWSRTASAGTLYASVLPRRVSSSNDYRCKVVGSANGTLQMVLVRRVSNVETTIGSATIAGVTVAANQTYAVACRAVPTAGNATQLTGKLWRTGTAEPTAWQVSATDSTTTLQVAGGIGVSSYLSSSATTGVTLSVDDLVATRP